MGILEIVAENRLGASTLAQHKALKTNLLQIERMFSGRAISEPSDDEKQRIASIVELFFEYHREKAPAERKNILRTLQEIVTNKPIELPTQTIEGWAREISEAVQSPVGIAKKVAMKPYSKHISGPSRIRTKVAG